MVGPKPVLTVFYIHHSLVSCLLTFVLEQTESICWPRKLIESLHCLELNLSGTRNPFQKVQDLI